MSLIGCVDNLNGARISGWAADDANYQRQLCVDIIINSERVATVRCAEFREDLRDAGVGDGCGGFEMDPGAYLKPGGNHLEVRYAGANTLLTRGSGRWIKPRGGGISECDAAFIAALEAYFEFGPEHHICGIGAWAGELERILRKAQLPFRKFTALEVPRAPAIVQLPDRADVVVCWAYATPSPECVRVLKALVRGQMNQPGLLAVGFTDTPDSLARIEAAFLECNAAAVKCESIALAPGGARRMFAFAAGGGVALVRAQTSPVLAHIHVPKCAGTSLRVLLTRHFGPRHLPLYVDDTYFVYGEDALRSYLLQDPEILGLSSHHVRAFPRWLAGREMLYVTFLRDPIAQFVSYMTHFKKYYSTITSQSLLEAVPPDAPRLALREFAKWLLTHDCDIPFRENHNVNFFSRHSAPATLDRLEAAKAALDGFFFVGITERMEESMRTLRALTREAGLDFPQGPIPVENTSAECRDDLSWINPDDEVGSLLLRSVEKDRRLYDWAAARLERI
jgi:Sulfotransferase family